MLCNLCPFECGVDRTIKYGRCKAGDDVVIARAAPHMFEEPCISGKNGSGTVFFSGCNLGCVYCQNRKISRFSVGKVISVNELAETFLQLQESGVKVELSSTVRTGIHKYTFPKGKQQTVVLP